MKKFISKHPLFSLLILIVIVIWILTPFIVPKLYTVTAGAGEIGDVFGSTNALFSGLALLGIIYTIMLQSKELGLQRKELN